jgi:DNA (cytosine-5)-methyltransferase 1
VDFEVETFIADVAHTLRGEGFDASEDGTGRGVPLVPVYGISSDALDRSGDGSGGTAGERSGLGIVEDLSPTLKARGPNAIAFPERMSGTQFAATEDRSPALCATNPTAVAFSCKDHGANATDDLSPTLRAMGHADSHANAGGQMAVAFDLRGREGGSQFEGPHDTANIRAASGGSSRSYVAEQWAVRRLTVTECERLMGFRDGWTLIEFGSRRTVEEDEAAYLSAAGATVVRDNQGRLRTNAAVDGPRYKALGNAWAWPCVRPVALRIMERLA